MSDSIAVETVRHTSGNHVQMSASNIAQAHASAETQKSMNFRTVMKIYYKAAFWSAILSLALVMEGYDLGVINSFWAQGEFLKRFGVPDATGKLYVPANWQAAVNNAALVGEIIGLALNGFLSPRYGAKKVYLGAMVMMAAAIFIPVFATDVKILFAGELICGIPWGVFQTLTTAYAADICPIALRGYMTAFVNLCWGIGLTIASGVVRGAISIEGQWSWRMAYVIQWAWPVPLFIIVLFAPESPWYLIRQGRPEDAKNSLRRLAKDGYYSEEDLDAELALMQHTNELEKADVAGATFADCFKKSNLRRTEIVSCVWGIQYFCGQPMINYTTSFLANAGLSETNSFNINLVVTTMFIIGTVCSWIFLGKVSRRHIYIAGCGGMAIALGVIGILGFFPNNHGAIWGLGVLLIILNFVYNITVGPTCYTIVGELPSTRVRQQSVVIARAVYLCVGVVIQQLVPRMLSPEEWNWGGRCGLFFLGTNLISTAYCYFRLPDTRGRTYGELEILFNDGVPARKFASTAVDEFQLTGVRQDWVDDKAQEKYIEDIRSS
ncbi:hypothetical protein I302_107220 [Kwoniella bestiolae CBS 10118]|uniref:Major facilitator superfamily (MFS) profile domain-containing protein n=1 Tax=Kwoniella bestiolae CBS 10118 TaxID=1296100 RepID=A0A1B9FZ62_9TREE|nr:hypothetical protein I302_07045 [Kwoniella bestiolae CBS 10118]OCF24059.1 hypothetical protein I302_07045 [Kwoniella bestiolae CBS 10118]